MFKAMKQSSNLFLLLAVFPTILLAPAPLLAQTAQFTRTCAYNDVLVCRSGSVSMGNPTSGSPTTGSPMSGSPMSGSPTAAATIASLPDGVYRFWSGRSTNAVMSGEELLRQGGMLFLFRKTGDRVAGSFSEVGAEAICVTGQVSGNTIAGRALSFNGTLSNRGETFTSWGGSGTLQVRRARGTGNQSRYESALLNLNGFNRINAGDRLPPTCR